MNPPNIRVIARLDVKGPNLVKGIHLEGLRALGSPETFAKYYATNGIDEIFYQDVVASLYNRNSLHDCISKTAKASFIPITVGGGLRTLDDIRNVLRAGADKVALNTAAISNPELIRDAANAFGSSTIVVAIEAIKQADGRYLAYTDNGREETTKEVSAWAVQASELGAGEILLTSVDRDGTGSGFDLQLTRMISQKLAIPVIAHGGAATEAHVAEVITKGSADAVALASLLHYSAIKQLERPKANGGEGNFEFINSSKMYGRFTDTTISSIKTYLAEQKIKCRPMNEESVPR